MFMARIKSILNKIKNKVGNNEIQEDDRPFKLWFENDGDVTHRLDYNMLNENSIVFDLGEVKNYNTDT